MGAGEQGHLLPAAIVSEIPTDSLSEPPNFFLYYTLKISVFFECVHGYTLYLMHKRGQGWMLPNPYFSIFVHKSLCISVKIQINLYTWRHYILRY